MNFLDKAYLTELTLRWQKHFEQMKAKMLSLSPEDDPINNYLLQVNLCFFKDEKCDFSAFAVHNKKIISVNIGCCAFVDYQIKTCLIHEFSHLICDEFSAMTDCTTMHEKSGGHCLEFAIINYCLQSYFNASKRNFLRSYDIHEDSIYPLLTLNPAKFDSFINSIEFITLEDLVFKARELAKKIRNKQLL